MSTSRLQMERLALAQISYESIDQSIRTVEMESGNTLLSVPQGAGEQLLKVYRAIRPLLKAVAVVPLLPPTWRTVMQLFVATLDEFIASDAFKAGKDLSSGPEEVTP